MKKFVLYALSLVLLLSTTQASGQIFSRVRTSSPEVHNMLQSSLKDVVCLLHLEYQLEDTLTHERYNMESRECFDSVEGLCIKTEKGWIASNEVAEPWNTNPNVKQFPAYLPYVSSASVICPSDTVWKGIDVPPHYTASNIEGTSYSLVDDADILPSKLAVGGFSDAANGWIAWVIKTENSISLKFQSHEISASDTTDRYVVKPVASENVIGALFVVPSYPTPGLIQFKLAGLLELEGSDWRIIPFVGIVPVSSASSGEIRLVPVKQNDSVSEV